MFAKIENIEMLFLIKRNINRLKTKKRQLSMQTNYVKKYFHYQNISFFPKVVTGEEAALMLNLSK